jgi:imidazolonepropionase-like amidohydrolase
VIGVFCGFAAATVLNATDIMARRGHGILEFQAMVDAGLSEIRAPKAATSVAAKLLGRDDLGVLAPGKLADIVAMPGDPTDDIGVTANVDFVMNGGRVYRGPETAAA